MILHILSIHHLSSGCVWTRSIVGLARFDGVQELGKDFISIFAQSRWQFLQTGSRNGRTTRYLVRLPKCHTRRGGTMLLVKFLYRNLKGYRFLVVLAILVAVAQVSCDIIALQPLKWIPSKAQNPGNDPACTFPFLGLNDNRGLLDLFDTPALDPSLNPPPVGHPSLPPPTPPCPATPPIPNTSPTPHTPPHSL